MIIDLPTRPTPSDAGNHSTSARPTGHTPVLLDEVVDVFSTVPDGLVIDGTVGMGGHAAALLDASFGRGLLGLDRDLDAVAAARQQLAPFGERAAVRHERFGDLAEVLSATQRAGVPVPGQPVVGILLDLGVSSPQLDRPERGFSLRADGLLDMRMDPSTGASAAELVNEASEETLRRLFAEHGEGRLAARIARSVVRARPINTTGELASVVEQAVPAAARRRGHPATRVFQALRVEVNEELVELERILPVALDLLAPAGRLVVIAYHSGEDRMVKRAFADAVAGGCTCPPGLPCVCGATPVHRLVWRGARQAGPAEVTTNPRSTSARMRAIERTAEAVSEGAGR